MPLHAIFGLKLMHSKKPKHLCKEFDFPQKRQVPGEKIIQLETSKERFEEIYKSNHWGSKESVSGPGSTLTATRPLRQWLVENVAKLNIRILVDAPCGDFNWMREVVPKMDVSYIGVDIVKSIISKNNTLYKTDNITFDVRDICNEMLPDCDLLIVRDCLFHLSYDEIDRFLRNIHRSDYRYLLTTTHIVPDEFTNRDIATGDFREIDLFSAPFNFDENNVLDRIFERCDAETAREVILIDKQFVPKSIQNNV